MYMRICWLVLSLIQTLDGQSAAMKSFVRRTRFVFFVRVPHLEVLVGQVVLQPQRVHSLRQQFAGQLLDGVLQLAELSERLLHQHHLVLGALRLRTRDGSAAVSMTRFVESVLNQNMCK